MKKIEKDLVVLGSLIAFLQASGIKVKDHIKDYDGTVIAGHAETHLTKDEEQFEKKTIKLANEYYKRIIKKINETKGKIHNEN
jgi:hypothetical protein